VPDFLFKTSNPVIPSIHVWQFYRAGLIMAQVEATGVGRLADLPRASHGMIEDALLAFKSQCLQRIGKCGLCVVATMCGVVM
jgi:hypothetical protein